MVHSRFLAHAMLAGRVPIYIPLTHQIVYTYVPYLLPIPINGGIFFTMDTKHKKIMR